MEARLEPIQDLLELLPAPLKVITQEHVINLLSRAIEVRHCERRHDFHDSNPTYNPSSTRFKFDLTCKPEYEDNERYEIQRTNARNILAEAKKHLRDCIVEVMKIELKGSIIKLQQKFIKGFINVTELWVNYLKHKTPNTLLPFNNEEEAESLLQKYFTSNNKDIFDYLKTDKKSS